MQNEIDALTQFAFKNTTSLTADSYGQKPIAKQNPEKFEQLVTEFTDIIDRRIETLTYRIEKDYTKQLQILGERIGIMKGKPRDVIDIYTGVLTKKVKEVSSAKIKVYRDEGRLLVLELMGHLASFYRKYYTGVIKEERT